MKHCIFILWELKLKGKKQLLSSVSLSLPMQLYKKREYITHYSIINSTYVKDNFPIYQNILETTSRLLKPLGIILAKSNQAKPSKTSQINQKTQYSHKTKKEAASTIFSARTAIATVKGAGRRLAEDIHKHQLTARRHDENS